MHLQTSHKEDHPCTLLRPSTLWLTADNLTARPGALLGSEPQQQQEQQLYASPEELAGQPRTRRSDMFGLAILFCVLFYGLDSITADGQIKAARLGRVPSKVSNHARALLPHCVPCQPENCSDWAEWSCMEIAQKARCNQHAEAVAPSEPWRLPHPGLIQQDASLWFRPGHQLC